MADLDGGFREGTRVVLYVPTPGTHSQHDDFLSQIFDELNGDFGGVTFSQIWPAVFSGWWVDEATGIPMPDNNVMVIVDTPFTRDDPDLPDLVAYFSDLKRRLQEGLMQNLIWMTFHTIYRITAFDPDP